LGLQTKAGIASGRSRFTRLISIKPSGLGWRAAICEAGKKDWLAKA
jgi:hypothetical protein